MVERGNIMGNQHIQSFTTISGINSDHAAEQLIRRASEHPQLLARFLAILDIVERDAQTDCTADQAEARVREELRILGQQALQHWAQRSSEHVATATRSQHPHAHQHSKKNSHGIPPTV